jgi:hypothetical protein
MLFESQINKTLTELQGLATPSPCTGHWEIEGPVCVDADFTAVDSLACAFRELRVASPRLANATPERLAAWAKAICEKVTYLLEQIHPLETDIESSKVLVRSSVPAKDARGTTYYEAILSSGGKLALCRYTRADRHSARKLVDMHATHEVLKKLVDDVVATMPV